MDIYWKSDKLKKDLENKGFLEQTYDKRVAAKIVQRLLEIATAPSYAQLPPASGRHPIKEGNKFLYYAVDLPGVGMKRGKNRLIFSPYGNYDLSHVETITAIVVLGIVNYHD